MTYRLLFAGVGIELWSMSRLDSINAKLERAEKHIPVNPLKPGDIILTVPEAEVQEKMDFRFTVSLDEPEIFERQTVIQTVEVLENIVSSTVFFFAKLL